MYVVPAYDTCMIWADPNNTVSDVRRGSVWYLYNLNWPPITLYDVRHASVSYLYDLNWPQ
jgi:hypothetical protein